MRNTKFKVNDKVEVISDSDKIRKRGERGTIEYIALPLTYPIQVVFKSIKYGRYTQVFSESELKLINGGDNLMSKCKKYIILEDSCDNVFDEVLTGRNISDLKETLKEAVDDEGNCTLYELIPVCKGKKVNITLTEVISTSVKKKRGRPKKK